ncbi:Glutathione-dependent formaldehyde-activating, GFA [Penicillium digitatum]|uniref:Glutathione-dependent formaldehyde-activating, GFA n=1 Tax=Penicillium digitatum TaxID=36651 RepID=A0A7T7BPS5_PENDI|nr:Glutathione-dependent formaldehyde-activating, GFA [Penicillium digitatum]
MSYQGHCNCESILITLLQQPPSSVICHCDCCKRAGGGPFSVNYIVDEAELTIDDPHAILKLYDDKKSISGNVVKRYFCSSCGSPVFTKTPKAPGKVFLKAALFDSVAHPKTEVFTKKQYQWVTVENGERQTRQDAGATPFREDPVFTLHPLDNDEKRTP